VVTLRLTIVEEKNDVSTTPLEANASKISLRQSRVGPNPIHARELPSQGVEVRSCSSVYDYHFGAGAEPAREEPLETTPKV
jgi:hypothetical protein